MYDLLAIEHSNTTGAESSILRNETGHHQPMSLQQVINRKRIQFQHELVSIICVPDLPDFIRISKDTFSINDSSHLE